MVRSPHQAQFVILFSYMSRDSLKRSATFNELMVQRDRTPVRPGAEPGQEAGNPKANLKLSVANLKSSRTPSSILQGYRLPRKLGD